MSAQPIETAGAPFVPQTIAEIRAALPADDRDRFDAALAGANTFQISGVVDEWWARAMVSGQLEDIAASFAAIRAGQVELVPAGEVVDDRRR